MAQPRTSGKIKVGGVGVTFRPTFASVFSGHESEIQTKVVIPWLNHWIEFLVPRCRLLAPIGPTLPPALRAYAKDYKDRRGGIHLAGGKKERASEGGRLRAEIQAQLVELLGTYGARQGIAAYTDYAARQYFKLAPAGPMKLGYTSRQQPSQPEGVVGGWFFQRAFDYHARRIQSDLAARLQAWILSLGKGNR